jgi:vacuolar protein-sorting-associated protein 4
MGAYMSRAEYIKKSVLDKPVEPEGGKGGAAELKKKKSKEDEGDEE